MHSRLHFLTSACLIAFGTVVVAGAVGALPGLIERLSVGVAEISPSCKAESGLPWGRSWGRTCASQPATSSVAARSVGSDIQVAERPSVANTPIVPPPQAPQNTASAAPEFLKSGEALGPAQQFASAPPAVEDVPQLAPTAPSTPITPSLKPKPRPVKKVARREEPARREESTRRDEDFVPPRQARRETTRERRRDEALSAVRRFGSNRGREIPVDAYAYDGGARRITIRPTSIQDVYYYYGR